MNNIKELFIEMPNGETQTHIIIDRGNNEYTSMLKSTYDEMIAKQEENK
jgi:hypothetical protein